jgi:hypothetical protein
MPTYVTKSSFLTNYKSQESYTPQVCCLLYTLHSKRLTADFDGRELTHPNLLHMMAQERLPPPMQRRYLHRPEARIQLLPYLGITAPQLP